MSETRNLIVSLVIGLIIGLAAGTAAMYYLNKNQAQQLTQDYEEQLTELQDEMEAKLLGKEQIIFLIEKDVMRLEQTLQEMQQNASLLMHNQTLETQTQIQNLEKQITTLQAQIADRNATIQELEAKLETVYDFTVTYRYEWTYIDRRTHKLEISAMQYQESIDKPRPTDWTQWATICNDTHMIIDELAETFTATADNENFDDTETVNYVAAFTQSLPFAEDYVYGTWDEQPRYPLETLFDREGDCGDTSILTAAVLDAMGYDTALIFFEEARHAAVGVANAGKVYGDHYTHNETKYFYLETTNDGWELGVKPPSLESEHVHVYPLKEYM
jgi:polyhydroxyalkanoate synthesis regulator phasin